MSESPSSCVKRRRLCASAASTVPARERGADIDGQRRCRVDEWRLRSAPFGRHMLAPRALWRAASIIEDHPNLGLVYGRPLLSVEGRPVPKPSARWRSTDVWHGEDWTRTRCRSAQNAMSSPEVVVRDTVQPEHAFDRATAGAGVDFRAFVVSRR